MRKISAAVDRFAYSHPNFGISNLMRVVVGGNVLVYLLTVFSSAETMSFLNFSWAAVKNLEVWRLVTFVFVPGYSSLNDAFWLVMFLYFYYFIGSTLEREWGTAKFTLYYLSGMVLTVLAAVLVGLITGGNVTVSGAGYINLSMFFAFAMLYPDAQVLLFFLLPVKIKWLAWLDGAWFALNILRSLFAGYTMGWLLPLVALLNFLVFFWTNLTDAVNNQRGRVRHQNSRQTIQFKQAARQQERKAQSQGYHHKCCVCGRTDADSPNLQFRYCSKCVGYHCYCEDHIFNHVHFTE